MRPRCHNRPPFKDTVIAQDGWVYEIVRLLGGGEAQTRSPIVKEVPDPMSKECQQHGASGEATLHPEDWDCAGCVWKPEVMK